MTEFLAGNIVDKSYISLKYISKFENLQFSLNEVKEELDRDELLRLGLIRNREEIISGENLNKLIEMYAVACYYLFEMDGQMVDRIFKSIETEYPAIQAEAPEDFRNENNVKTRYVNIPGVLEFKFDIEAPLFTAGRKIATIYTLNYNGRNLLSKTPIQLYQSTGSSRVIMGKSINNSWFPYSGRNGKSKYDILKKPEDSIYGYDLVNIFSYSESFSKISQQEPPTHPHDIKRRPIILKEIRVELLKSLNKLLPHISKLIRYFRFMDIDYAMSSYLVSKYEYEPLPKTEEQIAEETRESDEVFSRYSYGNGWEPPSTHKFYYEKYIKYKNKYMELKRNL